MNPPAAPAPSPAPARREVPFGVNAMRLTLGQWAAVGVIVLLALALTPRTWKAIERFETGPDYRIPYALSQDYWLYERWLDRNPEAGKILVVGDSVVWGEYVRPEGTLPHFLNREAGQTNRFVNLGMNGLFPLALEGLETYYGRGLRHKRVLLHCNLLWLSSPKADLQAAKEEKINHARLIPQFAPRIPCYRADANERLAAVIERNLGLVSWVNHLQQAYFESKSILNWTLQDDGADPPRYPNSYRNPLARIGFEVPVAPGDDPMRGPSSSRHVPWFKNSGGPSQFEWVGLETSLQWQAFKRLVGSLRDRGNEVFIILGPFNEHLVAEESRPAYRRLRDGAAAWFAENKLNYWAPDPLPRELYADASHPLTAGYEQLAKQAFAHAGFQAWMKAGTKDGR